MTQTDLNTLDPLRQIVKAEENLAGFRQNLIEKAWNTAVMAAESGDAAKLDELIRVHAAIKAIDHAMANKPSMYRMMAPI
jgi:hypothetical protein